MAYTPENNPYIPGDPYSYDLKWIVTNIKDLIANYTGQIDELKAFIMDYINSLDLSPIVAAQLQEMYDNGDFDAIIASFITDNKVVLVDTDQSAIFTETEKATGRKNIGATRSNENKLINGWFTINQRGVSGNIAHSNYGLDGWLSLPASNGYIHMTTGQITVNIRQSQLSQRIDNTVASEFVGRNITCSVLFSNGTISHATAVYGTNLTPNSVLFDGVAGDAQIRIIYQNAYTDFRVFPVDPNGTIIIKAVKLELGNVSTLINDAPPNNATELIKCNEYLNMLKSTLSTTAWLSYGMAVTTNIADVFVSLPVKPARIPTALTAGGISLVDGSGTSFLASSISVLDVIGNIVRLRVNTSTAITAGSIYALAIGPTGYILLSSEL